MILAVLAIMFTSPFAGAALAGQRQEELLDWANADRLAQHARAGHSYRALPRGAVRIRPIRASDGARLVESFAKLSPQSRRMRFMGAKNVLTAREVTYLTDVDHHDHEALVAVSRRDGSGLGVARYVRDRDDARSAELAVTVIDEWQLYGIGTRLVTRLSDRARAEGVTRFNAVVLPDNVGALRLLDRLPGRTTLVDHDDYKLTYLIELTDAAAR